MFRAGDCSFAARVCASFAARARASYAARASSFAARASRGASSPPSSYICRLHTVSQQSLSPHRCQHAKGLPIVTQRRTVGIPIAASLAEHVTVFHFLHHTLHRAEHLHDAVANGIAAQIPSTKKRFISERQAVNAAAVCRQSNSQRTGQ